MKIGELSKRSGLSCHTIRYYERIGLLPYADRDFGGQRDYDETILDWVSFLRNMKATGMAISQMLVYAEMRQQGDTTIPQRREMLQKHQIKIRTQLKMLNENMRLLDKKINAYQTIEAEMLHGKIHDWNSRFQKLAKS